MYYSEQYPQQDSASLAKRTLQQTRRRRMNTQALCQCIVLPCLLFQAMCWLLSFTDFFHVRPSYFYFALLPVGFITAGIYALKACFVASRQQVDGEDREPTWYVFLAVTVLIAWLGGLTLGSLNYSVNMGPYWAIGELGALKDVNPASGGGQAALDAGSIQFVKGAKLDRTKAIGYKDGDVYCVAPITTGNATLGVYDFWAVGLNCCNGFPGNFHCGNYMVLNADMRPSGLRLMNDGQQPYYRLAVEQAQAEFGIQVVHPLFFTFMKDSDSVLSSWHRAGLKWISYGIVLHFMFQVSCVLGAVYYYSKKLPY